MQPQVISLRDIVQDRISVATGVVLVPYKASVPPIFVKSMRTATPHIYAAPIRDVGCLEER